MKKIIIISLIVLLAISWVSVVSGEAKRLISYHEYVDAAEESVEKRLFEQAIEQYKKSLEFRETKDTYIKIKEVYDLFYEDEKTPFVMGKYVSDMESFAEKYPKEEIFWVTAAKLYIESEDYSSAYKLLSKGKDYGASGDSIDELYHQMSYMVTTSYKLFYNSRSSYNDYFAFDDGNKWKLYDKNGEEKSFEYDFIGMINDNGDGFYVKDFETRFIDKNEITRARFDFIIEDAGAYDEKSGYTPIKLDNAWRYINLEGEFLDGYFEEASMFSDGAAAVKENGMWLFIDENGKPISERRFEDVKVDLCGRAVHNNVILAKMSGKYHLYNADCTQIGDFECDDIDLLTDDKKIAFMVNGKWGFIDDSGTIIIEPEYDDAKSFNSGYAAIRKGSLWGFIDNNNEEVIKPQFKNAFYFNSSETAIISNEENTYQIMKFMF